MTTTWFEKTREQQLLRLQQLEPVMGLLANNVEKDFWLTFVLNQIFAFPRAQDTFVFMGGSNLYKCYDIAKRFSEDIDLAIKHSALGFSGDLSKNQINKKLRPVSQEFVKRQLFEHLQKQLNGFPCTVDLVYEGEVPIINVRYQSVTPDLVSYNPPIIKIEAEGRFISTPAQSREVTTPVDLGLKFNVPSLLPSSTLLQKIFLLYEEFRKPQVKIRSERMSRHLYDIYRVWYFSEYKNDVLNPKCYQEGRDLQLKFRPQGLTIDDYNPDKLTILPQDQAQEAYAEDYEQMKQSMIYDPDAPTFEKLLEKLALVQDEINKIKL